MTPPPLIWINDFPGSGKLTVANALVNLVGEDKIHLIDNHQLIDAVEAKTTRSSPNYQMQRRKHWYNLNFEAPLVMALLHCSCLLGRIINLT